MNIALYLLHYAGLLGYELSDPTTQSSSYCTTILRWKTVFHELGQPPLNIRGIDDRGFMQSSFSPSSSNLILMFHPHLRSEKKLFNDGKIQFVEGINVIRVIRGNDGSEFYLLTDEYYLGSLVLAFLTAWN